MGPEKGRGAIVGVLLVRKDIQNYLNISMAEHFKQLKIKTSMLRRLRKEYDSYQKETVTIQAKIHKMEADLQNVQKDEELEIHIRKNVGLPLMQKEFLNESESVRSNVKQKLIEAFEGLVTFLVMRQLLRAKRGRRKAWRGRRRRRWRRS